MCDHGTYRLLLGDFFFRWQEKARGVVEYDYGGLCGIIAGGHV